MAHGSRRLISIRRWVMACQVSNGVAGAERSDVGPDSTQHDSSGRTTSTAGPAEFRIIMIGLLLDVVQERGHGLEPRAAAGRCGTGRGELEAEGAGHGLITWHPAQQAHHRL